MADMFMTGSLVIGAANVILSLALLLVYGQVSRHAHSSFALALLLFAGAFLAHNALVVYSYATMMPLVPEAMGPYILGIAVLEAAGLGALAWAATRGGPVPPKDNSCSCRTFKGGCSSVLRERIARRPVWACSKVVFASSIHRGSRSGRRTPSRGSRRTTRCWSPSADGRPSSRTCAASTATSPSVCAPAPCAR